MRMGLVIFVKPEKLEPEIKPHLPIDYSKQIYLLIYGKDISASILLLSLSILMKIPIYITHFHY